MYGPRSRIRDLRSLTPQVMLRRHYPTSETWLEDDYIPPQLVFSGSYEGTFQGVDDVNTQNYKKRRSQGEIIMNYACIQKIGRSVEPSTQVWATDVISGTSGTWAAFELTGDVLGMVESKVPWNLVEHQPDVSRMREVALAAAMAKVNSSPIMGGELVGTMSQTVAMLRRPFGNSVKLVQKILAKRSAILASQDAVLRKAAGAKRYVDSAKRTIRDAKVRASAQAWLEGRYGWQPIIIDGMTIIYEVHKLLKKWDRQRFVARTQEMYDATKGKDFSASGFPVWSDVEAMGHMELRNETRACAGVIYDVKNRTTLDELNGFLGFQLRDIPATLWELTPWSFVSDWVLNVGDWLQAVTPNPRVSILGHWTTSVQKTTKTLSCVSLQRRFVSGTTVDVTVKKPVQGTSQNYEELMYRFPNPTLALTPTLTGRSMSVLHSVDAVSLLAGRVLNGLKGLKH